MYQKGQRESVMGLEASPCAMAHGFPLEPKVLKFWVMQEASEWVRLNQNGTFAL